MGKKQHRPSCSKKLLQEYGPSWMQCWHSRYHWYKRIYWCKYFSSSNMQIPREPQEPLIWGGGVALKFLWVDICHATSGLCGAFGRYVLFRFSKIGSMEWIFWLETRVLWINFLSKFVFWELSFQAFILAKDLLFAPIFLNCWKIKTFKNISKHYNYGIDCLKKSVSIV